jgi:hypothetical protein
MKTVAEDEIKSAREAVKNILRMNGVSEKHKREMLRVMLYKITEADGGKFGIKFFS